MDDRQQELLVRIMDLFADKFGKKSVLRGGMVLRVLGCERLTNDLDYIFMPFKSKKDIVEEIISVLKEIEGSEIEYSLNSKCLRVIMTLEGITVQIESKVAMETPVQIVSTKELSSKYDFPPRLIQVLDYPIALANKMAAWNERRLIRDIYDIWFYLKMEIKPDTETLSKRLQKCSYSKLVKGKDYFQGNGPQEFYIFLLEKVSQINDNDVKEQLADYLPANELPGLAMKFRAELANRLNS